MIWRVILCWLLAAQPAWANVPPHAGVFTDFLPVPTAPRLTNTISPLGRTNVQYYDHRGLVGTNIDSLGQRTTFAYDARGRLTNCTDSIGQITNAYDGNNNLTRLAGIVGTNASILSYAYDAYDRLITHTNAATNLLHYAYDANGNLITLTYPGGHAVTYAYDHLNRLSTITDWSSRVTTLTYDLANRLTSIARPNGTVRLINYDAAGQATNIVEMATNGIPIAYYSLNYDLASRVAWEFAGPLPHAYTQPTRANTVNDDNQLATFNGLTVVYDLNGNMISGPLLTNALTPYTFDARNRLTGAGGLTYAVCV